MVTLKTGGLLGIPGQARDRRMSTASMISAISRRSHVPKGDVKDDKAVLKSALKDTSALGRTKMGMQRWKNITLKQFIDAIASSSTDPHFQIIFMD